MTDNELLLDMSELIEKKLKTELQPLKDDIRDLKLMAENMIKPNIQLLAENHVPAAKRFERTSTRIESMETDIELLKKVLQDHSEKLNHIA